MIPIALHQSGCDQQERPALTSLARPNDDLGMRLRIGIVLWLLSWFPFAAIVHADAAQRAAIWTVQVVVGIIGLALAGTAFATLVKKVGWRHAPALAWHSLLHGHVDQVDQGDSRAPAAEPPSEPLT